MERPFAPSPRRRALARAAGLVLASPAWTAAIAVAAGVAAVAATVSAAGGALRAQTRDALAHAADGDVVARATAGGAAGAVAEILAAAAPVLLACAAGAIAAAAALARGVFVPRRQVRGAPSLPEAPAADAALGLARAAALAAVAASFVATQLPGLAELVAAGAGAIGGAGGGAIGDTSAGGGAIGGAGGSPIGGAGGSPIGDAGAGADAAALGGAVRSLALAALAHVAAAAVVLAAVDAVVRHVRLAGALRMTTREARDDARESGNDGHTRRRLSHARAHDARDRLREAAAILVGTDAVVALRWSPGMAGPDILVAARGLHGRQLVAAARARGVPALADDVLAEALASTRGAAPARHHAALARVLAAIA